MKILALDTTARVASAAICDDTRLISLYTQNVGLTHSETMLPMIEALLKHSKTDINDIDLFACSSGPGSFTGVRIGVSVIKGLAFEKNKQCIGVSTLEALARNVACPDGEIICPVMDARRNQLYSAMFTYQCGALVRLSDDDTVDANELACKLSSLSKPVYFVGDGYDIMDKMSIPLKKHTQEILRYQNAYSVAMAALEKYKSNKNNDLCFDDSSLVPEYLRPSQAERTASSK